MQNSTPQSRPQYSINDIVIDEQLLKLLPPLSESEFKGLEADIIQNGCHDPITVWINPEDNKLYLLDGHNRYNICIKNRIPLKAKRKEFGNKTEAMIWMINLQLNRRNLTSYSRIELAREKEELIGLEKGAADGPEHRHERSTNYQLGKIANVSEETVRKAKKIQEEAPESVKEKLRQGELNIEEGYKLTTLPERIRNKVVGDIEEGKSVKTTIREEHRKEKERQEEELLRSMGEPAKHSRYYLKTAEFVGGEAQINFDPVNYDIKDPSLDAETVYPDQFLSTREFAGKGNIFCDLARVPSKAAEYARSLCQQLVEEQGASYGHIIMTAPATTRDDWFQEMLTEMTCVCFVKGKQDAVFYYGDDIEGFQERFSEYGVCIAL